MKEMIYGDYPDFETLMQDIEQLENEINALSRTFRIIHEKRLDQQ